MLFRTSHVKVICSEESRLDFVSEKPEMTYVSAWPCHSCFNCDWMFAMLF